MARDRVPLKIGLRLDVLDNEGIWNTGTIVDVAKDDDDDLVEIKYDGWGDEYNEWVPASKQRLAPLHMFTIVKKCWAKLTKWPWWPAFVVLRAPTKRGAVESLDAETKVYVEFFDSFEEDKRSRCWMQKKSVVSFDDNFEERAAKNVGKNFHKFVEHTQRALASGSPLLFAGAGTLPIEYSSKSPLSYAAQKQKLGSKEWFDAYTSFSDRYRVLYGFEVAKAGTHNTNTMNLPTIQRGTAAVADEDAEVASGNGYEDEDESEEKDEPEEDEASVNEEEDEEEEEEEEAAESARGRRSARAEQRDQPKRKLPARASTRRNASKRVKAIEQLLQSTAHINRKQQPPTSQGARRPRPLAAAPPLTSPSEPSTAAQQEPRVPVLSSLDGEDGNAKTAASSDSAPAAPVDASETNGTNGASNAETSATNDLDHEPTTASSSSSSFEYVSVKWDVRDESQIFVLSSDTPQNILSSSLARRSSGSLANRSNSETPVAATNTASCASTPALSPALSALHRRKSPRRASILTALGRDPPQITSSVHVAAPTAAPTAAANSDYKRDPDEDDEATYRFWTGGPRDKINREPWRIQSWLLHGLRQKVEEEQSSSR